MNKLNILILIIILLLMLITSGCIKTIWDEQTSKYGFSFNTANYDNHPDFVIENLKEGIVFLHFSQDVNVASDIMDDLIWNFFNIEISPLWINHSGIYSDVNRVVIYEEMNFYYYYINLDHTTSEISKTYDIYDKEDINGIPMFTIITLGFYKTEIKPYYFSMYGTFSFDNNQDRIEYLQDVIGESIKLYKENSEFR